jgi:ABC-type transport system involved in multi-copper enzyme maturation permease subunit
MTATLKYVLITAVRDKLLVALAVALAVAICVALFIASSAIEEQNQFGLALAGEGTRLLLVLGLISFISFHIRRMHETREIEAILARPIARASFVLAYFAAFAILAVCYALGTVLLMKLVFVTDRAGLALWGASLALEGLIVVAIALFCAMTLESAISSVLAGLGIYLLARMVAGIRFAIENRTGVLDDDRANDAVHWVVLAVSAVMPRLDLFGNSQWLSYGTAGSWGWRELFLQTIIYVPLLLAATTRDLQIKRF